MHGSSTQFKNLPASEILLPGALTLAGILGIWLLVEKFFGPQDEGILLVYPDLILRGYLPYKDFAVLYPPGGFYLLAGVFRVFGESVFIERSLGATYWFVIVLAVYAIGSRINRTTAALAATTAWAYIPLFGSLAAHTHVGACACMLTALALSSKDFSSNASVAKPSLLLAGAVAGTTLFFKQDLGIVSMIAALVTINPTDPARLRPFFAGVAIPVCGLIVFTIVTGPAAVFDSLVLDVFRSAPGRFLPLSHSWDQDIILACLAIQCVTAIKVRSHRWLSPQMLWLGRGTATLSLGYSIAWLHRTGPGALGSYAFLVVSLTVVSLSILLLQIVVSPRERMLATVGFFLAGLLPLGILYPQHSWLFRIPQDWVYSSDRRVLILSNDHSESSELQHLLDEINRRSRYGEGLFVGPSDLRFAKTNDTFIYYLLPHLRPVSRYLEMNPGCANRVGSGLTQEIARADWLILTRRYDDLSEPNALVVPGPAQPNDLVRTHFCLQSRYGDWKLFHRCVR